MKNSKSKCNDSTRVLYSNVDSFLNKKDEFLIRINEKKPDIGLTEIRAKNFLYAAKDVEYEIHH